MSKKLIFFGNERLATGVTTTAPLLRGLISAGWQISAVVTSYRDPRSRNTRQLEIARVAKDHQIPVHMPASVSDIKSQLAEISATAGILAAYGQIIPQNIIEIFPKGIINLHPSLLPLYRGPTPIESAILDGASETGVSLMALSAKMDAGPVYTQIKVPIESVMTKQALADSLAQAGTKLMLDSLGTILGGSTKLRAQNDSAASYTKLITKGDGQISWQKPAEILERQVRAYAVWPKSRAEVFGQAIIITKARLAKSPDEGNLVMACRPGYLEIIELIGPSGRTMSGADFTRGYKKA